MNMIFAALTAAVTLANAQVPQGSQPILVCSNVDGQTLQIFNTSAVNLKQADLDLGRAGRVHLDCPKLTSEVARARPGLLLSCTDGRREGGISADIQIIVPTGKRTATITRGQVFPLRPVAIARTMTCP